MATGAEGCEADTAGFWTITARTRLPRDRVRFDRRLQVRRQRRSTGGRHAALGPESAGHRAVLGAPRGPRTAGHEPDHVALVVDPLRLRVDPAVAERHFLQCPEPHGLPP